MPPPPPPPQGASGQQLVGGVVGVQNRGVAPPGDNIYSVRTACMCLCRCQPVITMPRTLCTFAMMYADQMFDLVQAPFERPPLERLQTQWSVGGLVPLVLRARERSRYPAAHRTWL